MTAKELREALAKFPDDTPVYGEHGNPVASAELTNDELGEFVRLGEDMP